MELNRRRFLQVGALGVIAAVADTVCSDNRDRPLDQPLLIATLGPERVAQLGARYRTQAPGENSVDALRAAIDKARGSGLLGKSVDDVVHDDFENGRTVLVDGWLLSVTEARQAALLSLSQR